MWGHADIPTIHNRDAVAAPAAKPFYISLARGKGLAEVLYGKSEINLVGCGKI